MTSSAFQSDRSVGLPSRPFLRYRGKRERSSGIMMGGLYQATWRLHKIKRPQYQASLNAAFSFRSPFCGDPCAERGGFEPPVQNNPYGSLANYWFKPLTHLSCWVSTTFGGAAKIEVPSIRAPSSLQRLPLRPQNSPKSPDPHGP